MIGVALLFGGVLALAFAGVTPPTDGGATVPGVAFLVTTTDDHDDGFCDSDCTLREAINASNAHHGSDGIRFGVTGTINLAGPLPGLSDSVNITGPGANVVTVQRASNATPFRIFNVTVASPGKVNISGLTIAFGFAVNDTGGGIQNGSSATVTISKCSLTNNFADFGGGGIWNQTSGVVNIINSTLVGNGSGSPDASGAGGGIGNNGSGTINVTNSTLESNAANDGGGIFNGPGTVNVTNSTLSLNEASGSDFTGAIGTGGGIDNAGTLNVTNSTISKNFATGNTFSRGGGIYQKSGTGPAQVKSTIIALNTTVATDPDVSGPFSSQGYNLVGKTNGSTGFTAATDQTGTVAAPLNPKLDPKGLQDNGGPTRTIALLSGSPAIDKASSNSLTGTLTTDQRGVGYARTIDKSVPNAVGGDGTDIGAFEFGAQIKAVSRKTHGTVGNFDITLPLFGSVLGVECRKGGTSKIFKVIVTFPTAVTVGSASVTPDAKAPGATASVSSASVSGSNVTVNLTGVSNAQTILVNLFGVSDGTNTGNVSVPMGVLLGDTNKSRSVDSADVTLTQSKSGQATNSTNFREDVTLDGSINSTDIQLVQSKVGTKLP